MSLVQRLLLDLPFSTSELNVLLRTAPYRYKRYRIPKRSGEGYRQIAQPSQEIKLIQHWVLRYVLCEYPVHQAATAYRKGMSIRHNAATHATQRFMLKMDFSDFFPSIRAVDFIAHTSKYAPRYESDALLLKNLMFYRDPDKSGLVLSIGAPSSPAVSNSILFDFDTDIAQFAADHKIVYTRYADDLTFSTHEPELLKEAHRKVVKTCQDLRYPVLGVNHEKTIFASTRGNRTVTGLVLTNDGKVSVGWDKKRAVRTAIHRYAMGRLSEEETSALKGYLSFLRDVEPQLFVKFRTKASDSVRHALFDS